MLSLTGTLDGEPVALADDRCLLTVTDADGQIPGADDSFAPSTLIYPITAQTNIAPGETGDSPLVLNDESLAEQLANGGRLDRLVDIYEDHKLGDGACIAIDPALLHTVDRMSRSEEHTSELQSRGHLV